MQPGPLLFEQQGRLVYGLFGAMIIANACNLIFGLVGLRLWSRLITAPESIVFASGLVLCIVGVYVMLIFAALGMAMNALNYPVVIFVIAYFLGPRFEVSLGQTATILRGDVTNLTNHPVAIVLLLMSAISVFWLGIRPALKARKTSETTAN